MPATMASLDLNVQLEMRPLPDQDLRFERLVIILGG
jgi:hypothetical protein